MAFVDQSSEGTFVTNERKQTSQQVIRNVLDLKVEYDSLVRLFLVDTIHRIGMDYLFPGEIEAVLLHLFSAIKTSVYDHDLYRASLCFRLLRQQGHQVNAECFFGKFKDETGGFVFGGDLNTGIKTALELHQASQMIMNGEDILHEAARCSSRYLSDKLVNTCLNHELSETVKHALLYPRHRTLTQSKDVVPGLTNGQCGWEVFLQELADIEHRSLKSLHQEEFVQVVEWWKNLGLSKQLKSCRDQPVKWHKWSIVTLSEPKWSKQRILLTMPISLVYAVDDIFDLYGSLEELTLFTEAVNRWDMHAAEKLPGYMRTCSKAIDDVTDKISRMVLQEHGWNPVEFLRREWKSLFDAFLKEARWFSSGSLPKGKEYLENGVISSGVVMVLAHLFVLMGNRLTPETETLLMNHCSQGITYLVAKLLRLMDDLGTAEDEQQDGYDGSYIQCYMEEHPERSLEAAHEHVMAMVSETWKNLNQHSLCSSSPFSPTFRKACLNAARMVPMVYCYDKNLFSVVEHR